MTRDLIPPPINDFGTWRTGCGSDGPCVEVAQGPDGWRAVRDSKLGAHSPVLTFDAAEWAAFASGLRAGIFD